MTIAQEIEGLDMAYEPEIEKLRTDQASLEIFGRKVSTSVKHGYCVSCKSKVRKISTRPKFYNLWKMDGLCYNCRRGLL